MNTPSAVPPSDIVSFTIEADGAIIDSGIQVVSIDIWANVNQIPRARIVICDGAPSMQDFPISGRSTFLPGNKIEIAVGYSGHTTVVFAGVIVKQGISISSTEGSQLIVEAAGEAVKMTLVRKNANFPKTTDSNLITELISSNGLGASVAATSIIYESIVQYHATDWDLMLMRAELNSFVVVADNGKVTVSPPDTSQSPVLLLEYGTSILDLDLVMDAATQFAPSAIKSSSWDPATQQIIEAGPGTVAVKEQGNVTSAKLAKVFDVSTYPLDTAAMIGTDSLQSWSSAELLKSKLSKIRGAVRFQGSALAAAGKTIQLAGLGDRFNGVAYISAVHHEIKDGAWTTAVSLGLPVQAHPKAHSQACSVDSPRASAPLASGQLPAIQGLQTGKVLQVAQDVAGEFRVLILLPQLDRCSGVWARLAASYASNQLGAVFFPEIDDEVVVGFMNNDPRFPVILGSVYSKKLPPAYPPDADNRTKAIVTRSKLEIKFDDENVILQINTPRKQTVTLNDQAGTVIIRDGNNNAVTLSSAGITLDSASNIDIKAKGNIAIAAEGNLHMKAQADATLTGSQVCHTAQTTFSAQGKASAEIKSSGELTIKGALVMIN